MPRLLHPLTTACVLTASAAGLAIATGTTAAILLLVVVGAAAGFANSGST